VFNIREGEVEGTDIGGLKIATILDTPKVMTDGNWRLGVFVDEQATDEQADKLIKVFSGQLGGPMAALAPLVGERVPIEVQDDGVRHSVRVGDAIDFEVEDIVPFGVETGEPVRFQGMFHPVGSDLTMAEAKRSRINVFGIEYEARPASRRPSSRGPLDRLIVSAQTGLSGRPAVARRPRLGGRERATDGGAAPCSPLLRDEQRPRVRSRSGREAARGDQRVFATTVAR
jgi:hypothetical protein